MVSKAFLADFISAVVENYQFYKFLTGLPYIRPIPKITAVAGEVLKLKCPVSGYPIEQIAWEKGIFSELVS